MGGPKEEALTLHGLQSARGYLQSKVAERVKTRYTPELRFEIDDSVRKSIEASRIIRSVLPESDSEDTLLDDDESSKIISDNDDQDTSAPEDETSPVD